MSFPILSRLDERIHRESPGGASGGGGGSVPPAPPAGPAPGAVPPASPAPGQAPAGSGAAPQVDWSKRGPELEQELSANRAELDKARKEAAGYRTQNRGHLAEVVKSLSAMAGIELPAGGQQPDPQSVLATLQQRDKAREDELRSLKVDNALVSLYAKHNVDPEATRGLLLMNGALTDADPNAEDFKTNLEGAIKKLIEAKPLLKVAAATAPPRRTTAPMPPPGAPQQLTREELVGMKPEAIEAARKSGQLDQLLGRVPKQ